MFEESTGAELPDSSPGVRVGELNESRTHKRVYGYGLLLSCDRQKNTVEIPVGGSSYHLLISFSVVEEKGNPREVIHTNAQTCAPTFMMVWPV